MAGAISERTDKDYDAIARMPHAKLNCTTLQRVRTLVWTQNKPSAAPFSSPLVRLEKVKVLASPPGFEPGTY